MNWEDYKDAHLETLNNCDSGEMAKVIKILEDVRASRSTIWVGGNGGSAASASHAVADFTKTSTSGGKDPIRSIALSEMVSLNTAFSNDVSFEAAFAESLRLLAKPGDVFLLISVSGTSPNLLRAVEVAQKLGLKVVSLVGARGQLVARASDASIVISSEDYQVVENMHMIMIHWFVKAMS
jgi:D-sedoheptulose 7-phosphate isomerase